MAEKVIKSIAHDVERRATGVKGKIKTAAYCRVSTLQEEQELSYESQKAYFEAYIKADPNREFAGIYADQGRSGLHAESREQFQAMIDDAMDGKIDFIFTKSISRFSRNAAECAEYLAKLKTKGVIVFFDREQIYSNDPRFEMVLSLLSAAAQEEIRSLSDNIRWAIDKNSERGTPSRPCCYGYRKVKGSHKNEWEINPGEAQKIKLIFNMYDQGKNFRAIADLVNQIEMAEGSDDKWSTYRIKYVLTNEAYKGDILTSKTWSPDYLSKKHIKNKGQHQQFYIEEHHEAIIPSDLFIRVNQKLASGGRSI